MTTTSPLRGKVLQAFYLLFGLGIIFFLLRNLDFHKMKEILSGAHPGVLTAMIALALSQFVLASTIWNMLLVRRKIHVPFMFLVRVYLAGNFLAAVLPSKYTGDIYRSYAVSRRAGSFYDSAASVLLERLSGIFVLVLMGLIASIFCADLLGEGFTAYIVVTLFAALVSGTWLIFSRPLFRIADKVLKTVRLEVLRRPMQRFHEAIERFRQDRRFLLAVNGWSFLFKTVAFVCIYLAALSLALPVPFVSLFLIMPLIYVLEALPISINGLGVREGAFVLFFSRIGLSNEQAFALSMIVLFGRLVCIAVGGLAFLSERNASPVPRPLPGSPAIPRELVGQGALK